MYRDFMNQLRIKETCEVLLGLKKYCSSYTPQSVIYSYLCIISKIHPYDIKK